MRARVFFQLCCFFLLSSLAAQAQYLSLQQFAEEQGLDNLSVVNVAKDSQGMLWVATNGGLFRHDGTRFHFVGAEAGVPEGDVAPLLISSNGMLWAGYRQGLFHGYGKDFRRVDGVPLHMGFGGATQLHEGRGGEMIAIVGEKLYSVSQVPSPRGPEWVASDFSTRHPGFPKLLAVHSVRETASGLWVGCGQQICLWQGGKMLTWGPAEGVPPDTYRSILQMGNGEVWARSSLRLLHFEAQGYWRDVSREIPLPSLESRFCPLVEDPDGHLMASVGDNLLRRDAGGWTVFNAAHGMPENDISTLYVDRIGNIWIGTQGGGLLRWRGYEQWESFTVHEGLPSNAIWQISQAADGSLLAGTNAGLTLKLPGKNTWQSMPGINSRCAIYAVQRTADGSVWYPCGATLFHRTVAGRTQSYALPEMTASLLLVHDQLWISTLKGLFHVDQQGNERTLHRLNALGDQRVGQILAGRNNDLWVSSRVGIYHVDLRNDSAQLVIPASVKQNGFPLTLDAQGNLWFGSMGEGVNRARLQGNHLQGIDSFSRPIIHSRQFYSMLTDRHGWIWCGGDAGIDVYHDGVWSFLNSKNGLIIDDPNEGALLEDRDGSIWIGTSGGISHVLRPAAALRTYPGVVRIMAVRLNGKDLPLTPVVSVPPGKGMVEIKVGSSEHEEMPGVELMYRFPGTMENWTPLGESLLRISQAAPRQLQLQFQLMLPDGTAVSPMAELSVVIEPAWWRSPLALSLYSLAALALLFAFWHMRTHKMRIMQHRLKELVASRTAELEEKNRALEAARKELEYKAAHDSLTGLLNRSALLELMTREMERCLRRQARMVVVILDLDHFKRINDTLGHAAGDAVLIEISRRLRSALRPYDAVGRYGGEEFILVLPDLDETTALVRLETLRNAIGGQPVAAMGTVVQVTASFGYTIFKPHDHASSLLQRADAALYQAKAAGRNRVRFVEELQEAQPLG